jgi:signal transduction histidine kinase
MRVCVIGLGYVGAVTAVCLARDGHSVLGIDLDPVKLDLLRRGQPPIIEEGLHDVTRAAAESGRLEVADGGRDPGRRRRRVVARSGRRRPAHRRSRRTPRVMTDAAPRRPTPDVDAAVRALTTFVRWDQAALAAGVVALVVTFATVDRDGWLLVEAAGCAGSSAALGLALLPLRRGDLQGAVTTIAVVTWTALLLPSLVTPFVEPIMLLAALLPVVLAVPYVTPARLLAFVGAATLTSVVVLVLVRGPVEISAADDLPRWLPHAVVALFVPILSALVGVVVWHHHATLRRAYDRARATNLRLREAQRALLAHADELRTSRARLATATDDERRRIERDLHDGVQQQLLALTIDLAMARAELPPGSCAAAARVDHAADAAAAAMGAIRDLARGIYPAALTDHGLSEALAAMLRQWPGRCRLTAEGVGRYPPTVEAAVYFCCTEAVLNAVRHAGPDATIEVRVAGGPDLAFEVVDDGRGFDPAGTAPGRGIANLADRLAAVDGRLAIDAAPGAGTTVRGVIPCPSLRPPQAGRAGTSASSAVRVARGRAISAP